MPRFFFDVFDDSQLQRDEDGIELGNVREAEVEAMKALPGIVSDEMPDGDHRTFAIVVRDEAGTAIRRLELTLTMRHLV